jgi:hypothetical protein
VDSQEDLEELIVLDDKERENLPAKKKEADRALMKKQKDEEKEMEKKKKG